MTIVIPITGNMILFILWIVESIGLIPFLLYTWAFSRTTIASSTTRPTATTKANILKIFRVNPTIQMIRKVAIKQTGIVTSGIKDKRQLPINKIVMFKVKVAI